MGDFLMGEFPSTLNPNESERGLNSHQLYIREAIITASKQPTASPVLNSLCLIPATM